MKAPKQMWSGRLIDLLDIHESDIDIQDIAHAIGKLCRYTGACNVFYSVAEHSVHCSYVVPKEYALEALLHDAHEAYTNDISSPVKRQIWRCLEPVETRIDRAIRRRFDIKYMPSKIVKDADRRMLETERHQLGLSGHDDVWPDVEPIDDVYLDCWGPEAAPQMFLDRFNELVAEYV